VALGSPKYEYAATPPAVAMAMPATTPINVDLFISNRSFVMRRLPGLPNPCRSLVVELVDRIFHAFANVIGRIAYRIPERFGTVPRVVDRFVDLLTGLLERAFRFTSDIEWQRHQ
jgi:hypothetical protein